MCKLSISFRQAIINSRFLPAELTETFISHPNLQADKYKYHL